MTECNKKWHWIYFLHKLRIYHRDTDQYILGVQFFMYFIILQFLLLCVIWIVIYLFCPHHHFPVCYSSGSVTVLQIYNSVWFLILALTAIPLLDCQVLVRKHQQVIGYALTTVLYVFKFYRLLCSSSTVRCAIHPAGPAVFL